MTGFAQLRNEFGSGSTAGRTKRMAVVHENRPYHTNRADFTHWQSSRGLSMGRYPAKARPSRPHCIKLRWPALRYELILWVRCLAAVAITLVLLVALITLINDKPATEALYEWFRIAIGCAIIWLIFGPMWTLIFSSWRHERDA